MKYKPGFLKKRSIFWFELRKGIFAFLKGGGKDGVKPRKRGEDMRILAGRDAKRRPFRPKAGERELGLRP